VSVRAIERSRSVVSPQSTELTPPLDSAAADDAARWYQDAVIYELHVRAFHDSNGDGIGDFRGLTEKLDYIQDLGATAIWLLPFYPSPLKDDGYDIADYTNVNPIYGTLRDFKNFLREAHQRDLRVITELVVNHTSDQHAWFQRARRAKPGDKFRDFYVWSDDPQRYAGTRIIFQDFETSNWTLDAVANAYFWHRFYSHQPDLNFDNPEVQKAILEVLDFWMDMGVDGFRLDAVPYLYEREGTTCENLPETHGFLKTLRQHVSKKYPDRMLLAEANQWPEDAAAYFGNGDECHMNFHFPLMPRLFMSIQREDRFPIIDILQQTPALPDGCQWAIFLRNHDELTLEMVTDEERDYMYRTYAEDPQARINLGIRRRLGPLLRNNRRKMELINGLLCSLPGTPVIYYGDEIRMGDNIYLGDRDSVRTPMQWTPDRNAGFSRAASQKLYLPVIIDSEYHYTVRNVETEQNSPHSFLWWMRRLIALRRRHRVFGRGSLEFLFPENAKVLAYLRSYQDEQVLVVANLSRFVQCVELDLSRFRGMTPVELFGHTRFPAIGEQPYFLSIGPHTFYWLKLEGQQFESVGLARHELPGCRLKGPWENVFHGRARTTLDNALPDFLKKHRWFDGKEQKIQSAAVHDAIPILSTNGKDPRRKRSASASTECQPVYLLLVRVAYLDSEPAFYSIPAAFAEGERADQLLAERPASVILALTLSDAGTKGILYEAGSEQEFWMPLLDAVVRRRRLKGAHGEVVPLQTDSFRRQRDAAAETSAVKPAVHGGEQRNTLAVFGDRFIFKLFRRVNEGVNPDLEIGRFLTERTRFANAPAVAGALEYHQGRGEPLTLAILHQYVPNEGDAWKFTLDELGRYFERLISSSSAIEAEGRLPERASPADYIDETPSALVQEMIGPYLQTADLLGQRTAEMHLALASDAEDARFRPEAFTAFYQRGLYQSMRTQARLSFQLLRRQLPRLVEGDVPLAARVLELEAPLLDKLRSILGHKVTARRVRCHGDFHLGQILYTGKDFYIIDFEGEPARPISERRIKRSPLRDVAGMIRSLHYAARAALFGQAPSLVIQPEKLQLCERWMRIWYIWSAAAFLKSYLARAAGNDFLPNTRDEFRAMLGAYLVEKAVYELNDELNHRPDWVRIPLEGLLETWESLESAQAGS
jgi:maltose alpha-D-glucosyltransferase/alpha-amylase